MAKKCTVNIVEGYDEETKAWFGASDRYYEDKGDAQDELKICKKRFPEQPFRISKFVRKDSSE
jgi:hypothetical protein